MATDTRMPAAPIEKPLTRARRSRRARVQVPRYAVLVVLALLFFVPILGTFLTSLRTVADISQNGAWSVPEGISLDAYAEAFPRLAPHFRASVITTIPAVIIACALGSLAAYAISQFRFRGRHAVFLALLAGGFVPIHVQLIPVFRMLSEAGLYDTYLGLILVHVMRHLGIAVLIMTNFFNAVPRDLRNAARIDGAGELQIFWRIYLPLTRPALAALSIFLFTWIWNDLLWGLVLTHSADKKPVTVGILSFQGEYEAQWPVVAAGSLLATLPTIAIFLLFQRHFIKGLTMGSVKG
jgi:multiple sugar transport system permease protein